MDRDASQGWLFIATAASKRRTLFQPNAVPVPVTLFDLISPNAFSSLWYWAFTALLWSRLAHAPLGVPVDMYDRTGPEDAEDVFTLIRLGVGRHLAITSRMGPVLTGGWAFVLTTLAGLAILYGQELAQAILLILAPLALAQTMITRTARRMTGMDPDIGALLRELRNLRITVQIIALAAIFFAALFGMIHNLQNAIL